jgi:hypothetical protein
MSAVSISNKPNIAASTASESAMRGQKIVEKLGWKLLRGQIRESEERPLIPRELETDLKGTAPVFGPIRVGGTG